MPADTNIKSIDAIQIANGPVRAELMCYGATLVSLHMDGVEHSLVLGSADRAAYLGPMQYFGAIVGPVANRIAGGRAPLGDTVLDLPTNENGNALHGGPDGVSQRIWSVTDHSAHSVTFALTLPDGKDGLPGPLGVLVTYAIKADGALTIDISATTKALTLCNPAFHGYWCLSPNGLSDHCLSIDADHVLPVDDAMLPTGQIAPVADTPFDLRAPTPLPTGTDLDHNFCLNGTGMRPVARLETDQLALVIETDAPGLQVYDAARLDTAPFDGHHGAPYGAHAGIAMEPQLWPDAPNHPDFPPITLRPGAAFTQSSRFRFIRKETP
ncbi:galactose mutarotase [Sagittula sp. NFXS13]|uniref:aldose epimerase family protein n=1 Tax=Sagittula sp. NFXS13 TaxID=2819095 RepID=UPI0032DF8C84